MQLAEIGTRASEVERRGLANPTIPGSVTFSGAVSFASTVGITGTLTMADAIYLSDGAVGAPSLAYTSDHTSGLYYGVANAVSVAANGVLSAQIGQAYIWAVSGTVNANAVSMQADGTAGAPAISWGADPNTGFYRESADIIGITGGGVQSAQHGSGYIIVNGTLAASLINMVADGTKSAPCITWNSDGDTGIYRAGANLLGFAQGGSGNIQRIVASGQAVIAAGATTNPVTTVTRTAGENMFPAAFVTNDVAGAGWQWGDTAIISDDCDIILERTANATEFKLVIKNNSASQRTIDWMIIGATAG